MGIKKIRSFSAFVLLLGCMLLSPASYPIDLSASPVYKASISANDFSGYMAELREKIQRNWYPPEFLDKDGHALVKFSVTRHGDIYAIEILESSGNPVFDESAMEALNKAAPFDRFPAESTRGALTIKYSFDTTSVDTGKMKEYLAQSDRYYNLDNELSLNYINKAIEEVNGDVRSYFLYAKRSKIKSALGDADGALFDLLEAKKLKARYDKKRIMACKLYAEMEQSAYAYFSLAHSYEIAEDYLHAIEAIDKAINLTNLNNGYKRYKAELVQKREEK